MKPRFLDTFKPGVVQSMERGGSGPLIQAVGGHSARSSIASLGEEQEQINSYRLWNYVAINRICTRASEASPKFGVAKKVKPEGRYNLSSKQRSFMKQSYSRVIQSDGYDMEEIPDTHPLVELFNRINNVDWWETFSYETHMFWQLTGQFYWWVVPNGFGLPSEIYVIPNDWIRPVFGYDDMLDHWVVTPEGRARQWKIPADQISICRFKNPSSKSMGFSPSKAGAMWIDNNDNIEKSRWHSFQNSINPSYFFGLGEDYGKGDQIGIDVITRLKQRIMHKLKGVSGHGEPMIVPPGITPTKIHGSPKELEYSKSADSNRDTILALRGVPKTIAGISSDVNRSTIEGQNVVFCETTINPLLSHMAGFITHAIASRFDPRIVCWFEDCRPDDWERQLKEDEVDMKYGGMSPDELRMKRDREPTGLPAAQTPYIVSNLIPLDDSINPDDDIPEKVKSDEEEDEEAENDDEKQPEDKKDSV